MPSEPQKKRAVSESLQEGEACLRQGRLPEAEQMLRQVLALEPENPQALHLLGVIAFQVGNCALAVQLIQMAIRVRPSDPYSFNSLGLALQGLKRFEEALASFDRALALEPGFFEALNNRGNVLQALGRSDEALASLDKALALRTDSADLLNNRGIALHDLGRHHEALASYDRALALRPGYVGALINRGLTLQALGRHAEALAGYDSALALDPAFADALNNRGLALQETGRFEEACASYARALAASPGHADAHWNHGMCQLLLGNFEQGWPEYEWRWQCSQLRAAARDFPRPLWLGREEIAGRTVLLHAEQGLGDTIQFARYVPMLAAKGARVILEAPPVLKPLLAALPGVSQVFGRGERLPEFDFHCPLMSLPLAFGTRLESIPPPLPGLPVDEAAAAKRRAGLAQDTGKLVGVCWRGNPAQKGDRRRSLRLADFAPVLTVPGVRFVSLHKELTEEEDAQAKGLPLAHPGADFKATAEIIAALDLVISVDTAWAHWAGTSGKRVWILLAFSPDWRWMLEREDSPWYPSARLFRQSAIGDWRGVVQRVRAALEEAAAPGR